MTTSTPVVNLEQKSVTHGGRTFIMRPLAEDSFTIMEAGVPVGRAVYTFGTANGVPDGDSASEDFLCEVAEAWFAALDSAQ